jgi:uncharacterized protein (TIGR00299 family) protein
MKVLRFDSVGGASGDMILACLADLGADMEEIVRRLRSLGIEPFRLQVEKCSDHGLAGSRVRVEVERQAASARTLPDILSIIESSSIPDTARELGGKVFRRLAEAEARVHGTSPDKVHFHEVGAVDSIVDVIGACCGLELLGVGGVQVGALPLGHGVIESHHGIYPSPAPATVELLKGSPVVCVDEPFETVTPTGAALLTTWKELLPCASAGGRIKAVGCGFGHRRLKSRPNLLRATLLDQDDGAGGEDECMVLEFNVDDATPEIVGAAASRLMAAGALDVFTIPAQMKKQRPGTLVTVVCRVGDRDALVDLIFAESTTFGIREQICRRATLDRRHEYVDTPYGRVRVKIGSWKGKDVTRSPEYEDCLDCSRRSGVPLKAVYEAAVRALCGSGGAASGQSVCSS